MVDRETDPGDAGIGAEGDEGGAEGAQPGGRADGTISARHRRQRRGAGPRVAPPSTAPTTNQVAVDR